jgi:hypothetical protein
MLQRLSCHDLAVNLQRSGATTAKAANVVKGQRREAKPIVFEVVFDVVPAGC